MNCKRLVHFLISSAALTAALTVLPATANAYNFGFFGGRQGRPGVTDPGLTWNRGASGGQISWFFQRDQLTLAQANAAEFTAMKALIQPQLNKWSASLDLSFVEAANAGAADVVIEFETNFDGTGQAIPVDAGQGAAAQFNTSAGATLLTAEIGLEPSNHWAANQNDFAYVILHEWGHILGLGDLYSADHNGAAAGGVFEGEDFIDHGFPNNNPLNTNGKGDSVMNTRGVMELDNDDLAGAQWLWGALGVDSIVTGDLQARAANSNANETATHHGPNTWVYRGTSSVAAAGGGTVVTLFANGVTAARFDAALGGGWTSQILADRVIFSSAAGFAGNFKFELDSANPEAYINARIADNTPTDFTVTPRANGPQFFNSPQVFGPGVAPEPCSLGLIGIIVFGFGVSRKRR